MERGDGMNAIAALLIGAIVAYLIRGFLGESKWGIFIGVVIGFVVWRYLIVAF